MFEKEKKKNYWRSGCQRRTPVSPACPCVVPSCTGEHPRRWPAEGLGSTEGEGLKVEREYLVKKEKYSSSNDSVCGGICFG